MEQLGRVKENEGFGERRRLGWRIGGTLFRGTAGRKKRKSREAPFRRWFFGKSQEAGMVVADPAQLKDYNLKLLNFILSAEQDRFKDHWSSSLL